MAKTRAQDLEARRVMVRHALSSLPRREGVMAFSDTLTERRRSVGLLPVEEHVRAPNAVALVRGLLAAPPSFVVLLGASGSGKTPLVCAVLRHYIELALRPGASAEDIARARGVFYTTAYWPARARAETPLGRGEAPIVERCMRASVLGLDEFGNEAVRSSAMTEIVIERAAAGLLTIIGTKKGMSGLAAHYAAYDPESVVKRVYGEGTSVVIPLDESSRP